MGEQERLGTERLKHVELIQEIITRFATTSFIVKGWTVTVAAVFFGVVINRLSVALALIGVVPIAAFWSLDGMFLRNERLFRRLYDDVRKPGTSVELLSMDTRQYAKDRRTSWGSAMFSIAPLLFYGCLLVISIALIVVAAVQDG